MNEKQKRVGKARFEGIKDAWILVSGGFRTDRGHRETVAHFSFLYDNGQGVAVEWEPRHGPIHRWHRRSEGDPDAMEHYYFDYISNDDALTWTQLAVDEEELPEALVRGDYEYIYQVLRKWVG